jgi:hypothetical protein
MINKNIRIVNNKQNQNDMLESELDLAPDGYFNEIFVHDVLETSVDSNILKKISDKVRKNGVLKLTGIDGHEMCRRVYYGEESIEQLSESFFGKINRLNSIVSIKTFFGELEWNILFSGIQDGKYFVEVKKP